MAITEGNVMSLNEGQPKVDTESGDPVIFEASWAVRNMRIALLHELSGRLADAHDYAQWANQAAKGCWESLGGHFNAPTPIQAVRLALAD
jgi:hypothetical protein